MDTLDLLQRDARGLERALQEAGLRADRQDLTFTLRDQPGEGRQHNGRPYQMRAPWLGTEDEAVAVAAVNQTRAWRALDISV
jgi:flagellar hook-length control protein FliK